MPIEHVVVLMLENRSFDSMMGKLHDGRADFRGLAGTEANDWHATDGSPTRTVPVWNDPGMTATLAVIPDPDPGESFKDIAMQREGLFLDTPMGGFVDNYMRQKPAARPHDPRAPMHYFTPGQVPVLSRLGTAFAISDSWHASAPCQTWPNRFFAHCGTAGGFVDNAPWQLPFTMKTVFNLLSEAGKSWGIYFHDIPQSATLSELWLDAPSHFHRYARFHDDVATGRLPAYSFIEPQYFTHMFEATLPNDQHPPHNVAYGEQLIARTYNALRAVPSWERTLFIVTHDEHGGCFDHVPPPAAVPPGGPSPDGFAFDRLGVRVPVVIASPWIAPGGILRADRAFDHTSIIATLRALFGLGPLTPRDAAAPSLLPFLTAGPDNPGPESLGIPPIPPPSLELLAAARARPANALQASLGAAAAQLPTHGADPAAHRARVAAAPIPVQAGPAATAEFVAAQMRAFLGEI